MIEDLKAKVTSGVLTGTEAEEYIISIIEDYHVSGLHTLAAHYETILYAWTSSHTHIA